MNNQELVSTIERINNAVNVTSKLCERTGIVAEWISAQMQEHGITQLKDGDYRLDKITSSVASYTELFMYDCGTTHKCESLIRIECLSVGDGIDCEYLYNDYSASFMRPTRAQVLQFIDDLDSLLIELADKINNVDVDTGALDRAFEACA